MLLVLANAARAEPRDAMAGALLCAEAKLDSRTRSALLLAARVLMGLLLLYVGSQQLYRAGHRSELWTHEHDPNDAHDSHWLARHPLHRAAVVAARRERAARPRRGVRSWWRWR